MQCACAILSPVACPALQYFSTLSHKRHEFGKKKYWIQNISFDFLHNFCLNIYHSKKNWMRYDKKCILVFTWSTRYSCPILMKLELSGQIFEKSSNIKFYANPSSGSRIIPWGQTDRRSWVDIGRFSEFCELAQKWRECPWRMDTKQGRRIAEIVITRCRYCHSSNCTVSVNMQVTKTWSYLQVFF